MKYIFGQLTIATTALFLTSLIMPGLSIGGGLPGLFLAAIFLVIGFIVLKPILTLITLPIGMLTLGLFSVVITSIVLFLITIVDKNFTISAFQFPGFSLFFLSIPSFHANILLSYVLISVTIQLIYKFYQFVFDL